MPTGDTPGEGASHQPPAQPTPPPEPRPVALVMVCCVILACVGLFARGRGGNADGQSAVAATSTATPPQATPTPQPTPTADQRALADIKRGDYYGEHVPGDVTVGHRSDGTIIVADDVSKVTFWDNKQAGREMKVYSFIIFHALYQDKALHPPAVQVHILGQTTDQYGNSSQNPIATADLTAATAAKFNWGNLFAEGAWNVYDDTWLLPDLQRS